MQKGERMTKKELSRYYWLKHEISMQRKRLNEIRRERHDISCDIVKDYRTGRGKPTKIEGIAADEFSRRAAIGLLEEEIEKNIKESEKAAGEIEAYINTVADPKLREIMRSRFLDCKNWEEVGEANHIAPDYARRIVREYLK